MFRTTPNLHKVKRVLWQFKATWIKYILWNHHILKSIYAKLQFWKQLHFKTHNWIPTLACPTLRYSHTWRHAVQLKWVDIIILLRMLISLRSSLKTTSNQKVLHSFYHSFFLKIIQWCIRHIPKLCEDSSMLSCTKSYPDRWLYKVKNVATKVNQLQNIYRKYAKAFGG